LLKQVKNGKIDIDQAMEKLRHLPFEDLGFAHIDHHRQIRRGFPEVMIFEAIVKTKKFPKARYEELAKAIVLKQKKLTDSKSILPIVTAGTADLPVATEAKVTAEIMGQRTELICDVGVAGLHRLFGHLPKLQKANVIIVVAGMEGALASVVGGLVSCPVIAVPTSVGYGSSFEGLSALLTMLNSCAAGVTVVNIDNGFSAAVTATLINRKIEARK